MNKNIGNPQLSVINLGDIVIDDFQVKIDFVEHKSDLYYRLEIPHPLKADQINGYLCHVPFQFEDLVYKFYKIGLFPWFNVGESAALFFPPRRYLLSPHNIKVQRSLRPYFNQSKFRVTIDHCFERVIKACASVKRKKESGTWISEEFIDIYTKLHKLGHAHSVEVWVDDELIGGLYGIVTGKIFSGESMFSYRSNASKLALISLGDYLSKRNFKWIDCQIKNEYLEQFGGIEMEAKDYFIEVINNTIEYGENDYFAKGCNDFN